MTCNGVAMLSALTKARQHVADPTLDRFYEWMNQARTKPGNGDPGDIAMEILRHVNMHSWHDDTCPFKAAADVIWDELMTITMRDLALYANKQGRIT